MHRIPTPSTTDGMPSPSAAIAAVGVIITAGTAAPAATSRGVVPRSCAAGAGPLTKAMQRRATQAARATQAVISLEERAMIERVAAWRGGVLASVSPCEPNPGSGHIELSCGHLLHGQPCCGAAENFLPGSEAVVNLCAPELGKSPTHLILRGFALSRLAVQGIQHVRTHTKTHPTCRNDSSCLLISFEPRRLFSWSSSTLLEATPACAIAEATGETNRWNMSGVALPGAAGAWPGNERHHVERSHMFPISSGAVSSFACDDAVRTACQPAGDSVFQCARVWVHSLRPAFKSAES